ncbi:MAG: glycoside hydrolase family 127 protein [Trueperaceae bacterium]|nr:glycoside hydrolase family 127 protein [Trueperaceae bacterium]
MTCGQIKPVSQQAVKIDDNFWSPKLGTWHQVTIFDSFDKFEKVGAFANFDKVAHRQAAEHIGDPWWDGLVYEMITAAADFLAFRPNFALEKRVDSYIERIAAAAAADPEGYINTAVTLSDIGYRWTNPAHPDDTRNDRFPHTIYNAGCLVEAGVHYYLATGRRTS